jgi:hypothetical protein
VIFGANKNVQNYHFEFPCTAGKIISILSKRAVLEQKATKLSLQNSFDS